MRLWHENLLTELSKQRILGQHSEICGMRGQGWGQKHTTIDYVWEYSPELLTRFHHEVMRVGEDHFGINFAEVWKKGLYRGKNTPAWSVVEWKMSDKERADLQERNVVFPEHNDAYYEECLQNLNNKGATLGFEIEKDLD